MSHCFYASLFLTFKKKKSLLQYNFTLIRKVENTVSRSDWKFIHCHVGLLWAGSHNLVSLSERAEPCSSVAALIGRVLLWAQQRERIWCCRSARGCLKCSHISYKELLNMRMLNMLLLQIFWARWRWESFLGSSASAGRFPHVSSALTEL